MIFDHHKTKKVEIKQVTNELPKEKYFYLDDGRSFGSIKQFYEIIDSINDDEFLKHHINNNFGKWIRGVFEDHNLYHKLLWAKNKDEYKIILKEKLEGKKDELKKDELKKDEIKKDELKKDEIKKDEIKKDEIKKDEIKKDEIKKDEIKKDEIKKDEIKKDEIKKDEIKKDEIKKDEIKKDEIKKDEINKDSISKEDILKNEELKKEIIKKEEIKQAEIQNQIHLLERQTIDVEKERIEEEKSLFNELNYDNLITLAETELKEKDYEHALNNFESAMKIKQEHYILTKIDLIKNEILKITKNKKEIDFLKETENKSFAAQIEIFNTKFNEFKEQIKNFRKEGKDPYIADLHLMPFKSKIMIAETTRSQKDLDIIKQLIVLIQKELDEVEHEKVNDVKSEIEEGAKLLIAEDIKKQIII